MATSPSSQYDVFIIHTGYQKRVEASALKDVLKDAGFRCFVDKESLTGRQPRSPPDLMKQALEECRYAVAIISKEFLTRHDPVNELSYSFHRMMWIRKHYEWQYLFPILMDLDVDEYKAFQQERPKTLPELWKHVQLFEFHRLGGSYVTWNKFCEALRDKLVKTDTEDGAKPRWEKFLTDKLSGCLVTRTSSDGYPSSTSLYESRRTQDISIENKEHLLKLLPGTTWRKPDGLETVIFSEGGVYYNNLAGYPKWRKNSNRSIQSNDLILRLCWSVDNFETNILFEKDFSSFQEEANPYNGLWKLVALKPLTPASGV